MDHQILRSFNIKAHTRSFIHSTDISQISRNSQFYFYKADKAASYKILKLWEFPNFIFTKSPKFVKILSSK